MADMEEARDRLRFGRARKSRVIDEKEKAATAYHEAAARKSPINSLKCMRLGGTTAGEGFREEIEHDRPLLELLGKMDLEFLPRRPHRSS